MSVFLKEEIEDATLKASNILKEFISNKFFLSKEKQKTLIKTNLQIIQNLKTSNEAINSIVEIVLSNAIEAEKISPGGFIKTINYWINKTDYDQASYAAKYEDLKKNIDHFCNDSHIKSLILDAIELAGFNGKISIEKSSNSHTSVEVVEDYSFECKLFENSKVRLLKPKVLCIDGYVASISELNMLFESLVGSGHQLVIFAKGFDNDVISTVKVNNARSIFSVFLVTIPFVIDHINTLVDISVVTGVQPISSHLGQVISTVDINQAKTVEEIKLADQKVYIKNKLTKKDVLLHTSRLVEKLKNSENINDIYEKRIKSLNCNNVIIRIPDDKNFIENSHIIDGCLRSVKSLINFGINDCGAPAATDIVAISFSNKIKETLKSLGCLVIN